MSALEKAQPGAQAGDVDKDGEIVDRLVAASGGDLEQALRVTLAIRRAQASELQRELDYAAFLDESWRWPA